MIRQDRKNRLGGGTATYFRDGIAYLHRKNVSDESSEICWIEMCRPKCKKQFIYFFYKPPTFCSDLLINDLNQGLVNIPFDSEIIILGDFNINYLASKARFPLGDFFRLFLLSCELSTGTNQKSIQF